MKTRLASLDAFRGLAVAAMLLVNNPGDWAHIHPPLRHATWHGMTVTDWIFPFFIFISGMAMSISLAHRMSLREPSVRMTTSLMRRGLVIVCIGLVLNAVPAFDLQTLRWPGVLQRIGLCTLLCAPVAVYLAWRAQALVGVLLLVGYSVLMLMVPVPGDDGVVRTGSMLPGQDTGSHIDRLLMGGHLWAQSRTWDPEGLLSTMPALATQIAGLLAGRWVVHAAQAQGTALGCALAGLAAIALGEALDAWNMPVNKALWTPAYVAATAGWALLLFAVLHRLLDGHAREVRQQWWRSRLQPLIDFGMNALFLFVLGSLLAKMLVFIKVDGHSLKALLVAPLQASGLLPANASLLYAVGFVAVLYGVARLMAWRRWFITV